jgi:hypothetical protein
MTMVAKRGAPVLRDALAARSMEPEGDDHRRSLGQLLNYLDNLVRDNPQMSSNELDRFVLGLSLVHMMRDNEELDLSTFQEKLHALRPEGLKYISAHAKTIFSVRALTAYLKPHQLHWITLWCLATRLKRDCWEMDIPHLAKLAERSGSAAP